jgi:hypothetical protein
VTATRQLVTSGIYLASIEVTENYVDEYTGELLFQKGDSTIRKFIIIR